MSTPFIATPYMIPVLMITYGRLEYTKRSIEALIRCPGIRVHIIDNGSMDGTPGWIMKQPWRHRCRISMNLENEGVAGAMNQFLKDTEGSHFCGKVDNDSVVPKDWAIVMASKCITLGIDIMQAKHQLIPAVDNGKTFDQWVSTMHADPRDPSVRYNHFVGGSGIIFRRDRMSPIPKTEWKLYGWRQFQRENPKLKKAFCTDVEIQLLDGDGDYSAYPEYYKNTGRLK